MDENMMLTWLQRCHVKCPNGFFKKIKALLVMDSMMAHITDNMKTKVKSLNSIPVIIPGGLTKILQPLDIANNQSFKALFHHKWELWMMDREQFHCYWVYVACNIFGSPKLDW